MVKFSDLLVDKSLHALALRHSAASLIFMTSSITYSFVALTIESATLCLQLTDVHNIRKNRHFCLRWRNCQRFLSIRSYFKSFSVLKSK